MITIVPGAADGGFGAPLIPFEVRIIIEAGFFGIELSARRVPGITRASAIGLRHALASADFNGDGIPDLVVAGPVTNNVAVLLGDGLGGFSKTIIYDTCAAPVAVTALDADGDGKPDIAVACRDGKGVQFIINKLTPAGSVLTSVSAATFTGTNIAPGSIVSGFGLKLATATAGASSLPLPLTLSGTRILVRDSAGNERRARIFFVSPGQVNFECPGNIAVGPARVTIIAGDGSVALGTIVVRPTAPGLFTANSDGKGVAAGTLTRVRGADQTPENIAVLQGAAFVAAPIDLGPDGDQIYLTLYGTGLRRRASLAAVSAKVGGVDVPVAFAGAQGGFAGLDQLNIGPLPRSLAGRGEVPLDLIVDGRTGNRVTIAVK